MASERRLEKLNILLKEELSKIIARDVELPGETMITITRVVISTDVKYAAVFLSILGENPKEALEILSKSVYNLQHLLTRRLKMRPVPKIHFKIDEEEFRREKVEKSLSDLKKKGEI
jgi:ribosome-binding factor A